MSEAKSEPRQNLKELATVFFKLGTIAFGGPVAHIAMMEEEIVNRRRQITSEKLLDLLGVTSLIPGPNSTELAIHIRYERAGWKGLFVAGSCFIKSDRFISISNQFDLANCFWRNSWLNLAGVYSHARLSIDKLN